MGGGGEVSKINFTRLGFLLWYYIPAILFVSELCISEELEEFQVAVPENNQNLYSTLASRFYHFLSLQQALR